MEHEMTITEMLAEYNKLGNELLTEFGDNFRERSSFRDRADATAALTKIREKHKLRKESFKQQESQSSTPGLKRLRESANAEELRQETLAEQKQASEIVKKDREDMAATAKKKVRSVTPSRAKKSAENGRFAPEAKITLLVKDNPRRKDSDVYNQFELARKHKTVSEFVKAGGRTGTLHKGVEKKWLKVE